MKVFVQGQVHTTCWDASCINIKETTKNFCLQIYFSFPHLKFQTETGRNGSSSNYWIGMKTSLEVCAFSCQSETMFTMNRYLCNITHMSDTIFFFNYCHKIPNKNSIMGEGFILFIVHHSREYGAEQSRFHHGSQEGEREWDYGLV